MTLTNAGYQPIGAGASLAQHGAGKINKYSPDQPRVSAGDPAGGQWTSGGGGGASAGASGSTSTDNPRGARVTHVQFLPPILAEPPVLPPLLTEPPTLVPSPPLEEWPTNPNVPPGPGWEWRGGPRGSWYDKENDQSLHPHFENDGHEPHWDWRTPNKGPKYRWYSDGRLELKPK